MRSMLVIDHSETIAKAFGEIFKERGWDVDTCGDRDTATARLAGSKPYDTVLLSYRVSGTNGVELVGLIRALEHRRMTTVVMVTSKGEIIEQALAAGADEVVLRPGNPIALIGAVCRHFW